jgi:hypothetical protein
VTPDRGFVPRAGRRTTRAVWGWDVALAGWTGRATRWVATRAGALTGSERTAHVRTARRVTKRVGRVRVARSVGSVVTGRPVGTRMGKGKGKPVGHRGWTPAGATLLEVVGPSRGLAVLAGRSSGRAVRVTVRW